MSELLYSREALFLVIGLMPAIAISFYFYRKSRARKQIVYTVKVEDVLFRSKEYPNELEISYAGRPINVLTKVLVYVWNEGNQAILAADLRQKTMRCGLYGRTTSKCFRPAFGIRVVRRTASKSARRASSPLRI